MVERAFPTEGETHGVLIKISVKNFVAYSAGVHRSRELLHRHPVELGIKNLGFMGALFLFFFYESFYVRLFSHTQLSPRGRISSLKGRFSFRFKGAPLNARSFSLALTKTSN